MKRKPKDIKRRLAMLALATGVAAIGATVNIESNQYAGIRLTVGEQAHAGGSAPEKLVEAINSTEKSVEKLRDLAVSCLTVALVPLGSMLSLKFLNMVMSRV